MRLEWANISAAELWWAIPALLAFLATLVASVWAWRSFSMIRTKIRQAPEFYRAWGPRWNFSLALVIAMPVAAVGWAVGMALSIVAMMTPPPVSEVNREAASWFAVLFIFRDITFATFQVLVWVALRALATEPWLPWRTWRAPWPPPWWRSSER